MRSRAQKCQIRSIIMSSPTDITHTDREFLRKCVELAQTALQDGDEPFGSLLVDANGEVLFEDRNRAKGGDHTQHPVYAIARWASQNLSPQARQNAQLY